MSRVDVSVVVPCFNQGRFLMAALKSVALSTKLPHEVVIIDDGSTDRQTLKDLESIRGQASHQSVKLVSQENEGLAAARNNGLSVCDGQWIQFLDADDLLIPGSIDSRIATFDMALRGSFSDSQRVGVIGQYVTLDDKSGLVSDPPARQLDSRNLDFFGVARKWERGLSIPIHCALFRRDRIALDEWFDPTLKSKEDWYFWLTMTATGAQFVSHDSPVAIYRMHGANMTNLAVINNAEAWLKVCEMANSQWPHLFTDDDVVSAHEYWRSYYWPKVWGKIGLELPWRYFQNLFEDPKIRF